MEEKNPDHDPVDEGMELQQMPAKSRDPTDENMEEELPCDISIDRDKPPKTEPAEDVEPSKLSETKRQSIERTRDQSARPPDASYHIVEDLSQPFDRPLLMARVRPPSLTGVLDVSDISLIPSPGEVPEDTCTFVECDMVEGGGLATPFDVMREHPGINAEERAAPAADVERKLDEALREGDFDLIQENVTPKTLTNCKTNALLKAFEVNKTLRYLVENAVNPETDEIETLSKSVNEFTSAFISPLRSDSDTRSTFKSCLDYVVDKAIDAEQKKFISHPVVYNLLNARWYRSFASTRKHPWTSAKRWGYLFLNFWTLFDLFLFPFLFAILYLVHLLYKVLRRTRDTEVCFVVTLANHNDGSTEKVFALIKKTISFLIHKYGYRISSTNYNVILRAGDRAKSNINFESVYSSDEALQNSLTSLKSSTCSPRFYEDLCAARDAFKGPKVRKNAKKILVVFTNGQMSMLGLGEKDLTPLLNEIKAMGIQVVPVGIGEYPKLSELEQIASDKTPALRFGEYEAPRTLGKAIIHGVEGMDVFDCYLDYFTTPYFVFVRDTLSYLTLLGLHFDICLSSPTLAFSRMEWVILVFFLGRIAIEVDQFMGARKAVRKTARQRSHQGTSYRVVFSPPNETQMVAAVPKENEWKKKFNNYFSDRWNTLDLIILLVYIAILTLRMITWVESDSVSDNRLLAVAGYLYGFNAMFLNLRVFGHVMESMRRMGAILIAFFFIVRDVFAIFWEFVAMILAFSLAMTKIYVVENSYAVNGTSDSNLVCSDVGFACWWNMTKFLSWSCLGITDLEPLNSVDVPSMTLLHLLYSLFLIMVVILLVNMMVALLTNTYDRVQDNSLKEWSFEKSITIRSYSSYHPVPVPFNIISIPVLALWRLCRCSMAERHRFHETSLDKVEMKIALDKLMERLERTYFATYGYSFPLTEERKIDQLLHENEGSRQMANQIVHRVFTQQGCKRDKDIRGARQWNSLGIGIQGCLLTYEGPESCEVCKDQAPQGKHDIHGARYLMPFTEETPRIEVLIQESGERRILAVGAVFESYNCHRMPGWDGGTVGYHVDDGKIFEPGYDKLGREVEGAMAHRGDLIACEVDFDRATSTSFPVVFFLNGREVARAPMKRATQQAKPYPFIAMGYKKIRVLAKMCPRDGGLTHVSNAGPVQRPTRNSGMEQEMASYVKEQCETLREEMEALELDRRAQAMEFRENLNQQQRMLEEIRELVMQSIREIKNKQTAANNRQFVTTL